MTRRGTRTTRWATRGLALLFAAGVVFWLLWVPYRPERAARAIPFDVLWVSRHEAPADRWVELIGNPAVQALLVRGLGLELPDAPLPLPDRFQGLLSDRVWLAQAKPDPFSERTAIYGSAWAGPRGRRLRWEIKLFRPPHVEHVGDHAGRVLYRLHLPDLPPPWRLALAFEEGLVLFCLSDDEQDIRHMLNAYDGRVPSILDTEHTPPPDTLDAALVRTGPVRDWALAIETLTADKTSLRVEPATMEPAAFAVLSPDVPAHAPPWGDAAAVTVHVRPDLLARAPLPTTGWGAALNEFREEFFRLGDGAPILLGLFGDSFSGRYRGIRVPGLAAVVKTKATPAEANAAVSQVLDRLNARYHLGWIPADGPPARVRIRIISGTRESGAAALTVDEAPAYALHNGFLWLASNAQTLQGLIDASPADAGFAWRLPDPAEDLLVQADFNRAEPTLRLAYHVYRLLQIVEQRSLMPAEVTALGLVGQGLDAMGRFGKMEISARRHGAGFSIHGAAYHPPSQ